MKNQEKDLKNENTGSTRRKLTKEELTALCRRMEKHVQKFGEYMRKLDTFGGAYHKTDTK